MGNLHSKPNILGDDYQNVYVLKGYKEQEIIKEKL